MLLDAIIQDKFRRKKRKWFENYVLSSINNSIIDRPILPIVSIDSIYQHYNNINGGEMIDILDDMISLSYKENYIFWYVGTGESYVGGDVNGTGVYKTTDGGESWEKVLYIKACILYIRDW